MGLAVLLQWVQLLLLFFGPGFDWNIDWHGNRWEVQSRCRAVSRFVILAHLPCVQACMADSGSGDTQLLH